MPFEPRFDLVALLVRAMRDVGLSRLLGESASRDALTFHNQPARKFTGSHFLNIFSIALPLANSSTSLSR